MWILTWTKYKVSKFATFISVVGALTRYGGVLCLFSGLIPAALICIAIGVGGHFLAEEIAYRAWIKLIRKENLEPLIRGGDTKVALELYNANPTKRTLRYFYSLNPQVSAYIENLTKSKG